MLHASMPLEYYKMLDEYTHAWNIGFRLKYSKIRRPSKQMLCSNTN